MCGIVGFVDLAGRRTPDELRRIALAMRDVLSHRGPDDAGVWVDPTGRCALAHRRLSILDLSERGRQPMVSDDGWVGLTFNGEIYSYADLKADLVRRGYAFHSDSDSEVLLHLFASGEPSSLSRLEGMYAFATWNGSRRRLFLARDAFGKKPLYLARGEGWLAFASELSAFREIPGFQPQVDPLALSEYLLLQYVHAPRTIWKDCEKLRPGHWLSMDLTPDGPRFQGGRHFRFEPVGAHRTRSPYAATEPGVLEAHAEALRPVILKAVERRLMSDVPLGAFLSGGIDSALVVAMMRRELGIPVKTFTIGFADTDESEHEQAREAATLLGTEHHEKILAPDALELLPRIAEALDEPLGDSSCLPTWLVSEFTRQHVTVALSGDGGDELFGGYGRYRDTLREEGDWKMRARYLVRERRAWRAGAAYCSTRWLMFEPGHVRELAGAAAGEYAADLVARWSARIDGDERPLVHRLRELDVDTYMPGAVLAKVDRMAMRFALEVRCPLLDRDVAAAAAELDAELVFQDGLSKPLLRTLLRRYMPEEYVRRKKMGFGLPGKTWTAEAVLALCDEVLLAPDSRVAELLEREGLRRFLAHQRSEGCFSIFQVWTVLVLEFWLRAATGSARRQPEEVSV